MTHHTGSVPEQKRTPDWRDQAECARPEYRDKREMWWPRETDATTIREAKAVCWTCPVLQTCRSWSFEQHEDRGIWGGMTERERRRIHKRPAPKHTGGDGVNAPGRRRRAA
jgi:WhiB family redox-sensing transcriptional regulator